MFEEICSVLAERFATDASAMTRNTLLRQELGAASQDLIELMMDLEDHFGITIANAASDEAALEMRVIDDLVVHFSRLV